MAVHLGGLLVISTQVLVYRLFRILEPSKLWLLLKQELGLNGSGSSKNSFSPEGPYSSADPGSCHGTPFQTQSTSSEISRFNFGLELCSHTLKIATSAACLYAKETLNEMG
jgi:hypothetical protein